jgi:hypothetical protein
LWHGWSRTLYDLPRITTWALLIFGLLSLAFGLFALVFTPAHTATGIRKVATGPWGGCFALFAAF